MRIAVDANVLASGRGGIPRYLLQISERLGARGHEVLLVANRRRWEAPVGSVRAVGLRLKNMRLWRATALPAWAAATGVDVLWAPETTLPPRIWGVGTVSTIHDLAPLLFPGSKSPAATRAFTTTIPRSVRGADRVICVSRTTADDVRATWGIPEDRLRVIHNGVDASFSPGDRTAAIELVRRRFGLRAPYVLHVGALEPRKGLDVLIDAAATAPGWQLVLAGSPAYDGERLAGRTRAAGGVVLEPPDDAELHALYRAAEVVAAPALYEGFGIVPLEAMASGTPVVIAGGSGALEEISGPASVVVKERTPEAWVAGVAQARERREQLVATGLAHARKFDWDVIAAQTEQVLNEAADAATGGRRRRAA